MNSKKDQEAQSTGNLLPMKRKQKGDVKGAATAVKVAKKDMWRPDEDLRLMQIIDLHSARNWNEISNLL